MQVVNAIFYDFTVDFPDMKKELDLNGPSVSKQEDTFVDLGKMEGQYRQLLERYDKLLDLLVRIADQNELEDKKSMEKIIKWTDLGKEEIEKLKKH